MLNQRKFLFIIISGILIGTVSYGLHQSLKCFNDAVGDPDPFRFAAMVKLSPLEYHFEVMGRDFEINVDRTWLRR
ncbi:MAG TPA: hypothetical protein DCK76_07100 [Desulfotomaculum sp.]|nr:MAG: hypothetical protein XD84_0767 [Desulfotomaculum sp. 46_80]KUK85251.1 MAG: hypothetical protein XE00_0194 [Desulfofundulus kuznetsovii]HAG11135.1 hypothetical protein [Desulfotomaculum sp.]HBY03245.1 hypothetical protein [Desulfotomaculum sp.]